ncbi:hypothetical protein N7495_006507 [Penicillium taxi]|uniref:uncharacterized protein n=1 Tax=Penicillium taxi TaxID=168475 RepID=UPI0025451F3B|nr:uncharacterized protein N7495_006507 [Penicillium taxi]KAJ5894816.1 hypothetical protein N7495_006507 [Penicillium taxi]
MCRSVAQLLRAPHVSPYSKLVRRHPSSLKISDRSRAVANFRSVGVGHVRHAFLDFRGHTFVGLAASHRQYSQIPTCTMKSYTSSDTMADILGTADIKQEILDESVGSPAGQAAASLDPEFDEAVPIDPEELKEALGRPPPVHSSYLPLPWKGRLGYACLNTYLRYANPPVFCSRTCRIASILENRHPLQDPDQPPHPTKNRPDRNQPADIARGQAFVEALALANASDMSKILRWNDKYGIKFMRLSSEMFPFASHKEYGYKLAPFASEVLAEVGRVVAELGHRVSVHPGQFTQLGTPRTEVVESSYRDLEYHSELLQLLKLPPQQNRDAVMILHMGGVFGDKEATLDRFRENYAGLSQDIKNRLVLENDDVSWSVHDLLPICEELNIPLVLDYHHHNIIFDANEVREGTQDIIHLYDRIAATWSRKNITQKMHYSEPEASAITPRQRRKHSARVSTLPPCAPTMDLMIEAKDKEQAVFELMKTFKLPGHELVNDLLPHLRTDENKTFKPPRRTKKNGDFVDLEGSVPPPQIVSKEEMGMGGPERRVYWPPGMEEWLRPAKKAVRPTSPGKGKRASYKKAKPKEDSGLETPKIATKTAPRTSSRTKRKAEQIELTPESSELSDLSNTLETPNLTTVSRRSTRAKKINYTEDITSSLDISETLAPKSRFRWSILRPRPFLSNTTAPRLFPSLRAFIRRQSKPSTVATVLRILVGPQTTRRTQNRLWNLRHETLPALRHRAQSRIYQAIVQRQQRRAVYKRGLGRVFLALLSRRLRGRQGDNFLTGRARAIRGSRDRANVVKAPMSQSSAWGDSASAPGSKRKKAYEWLKAANELGQAYTSRWTAQRNGDDYYNTPGAFPDVEIARSGDEQMVLFPSYARQITPKKRDNKARERRDSWTETLDDYRGVSAEDGDRDWTEKEIDNAVVEVDVRGWIYSPSSGPMSRKHRLMVKLARTLSGIPVPTDTPNDDSPDRISARREDEDVKKEMKDLVDAAEHDADQAWKNSNEDRGRADIGQPMQWSNDQISLANAHLMERLRPFLTNPVAVTPVTIFFFNESESESRNIMTDESGHFTLRAPMPFVPTHIRVLASEDLSAARQIEIIKPVGISLISDIDDTVKHSAIASGAKEMFRNTFVRELAELSVDGVSDWYTEVAKRGVEMHYVSNAPWQLYPLLERYFKCVGLPPGSFHLKHYTGMLQGIFEPTAERKRGSLEQIMRDFPERKFILVGDSGEADLEVYTDLVLLNPGRILGIFIRDVTTPAQQPLAQLGVNSGHSRSSPQLANPPDRKANAPPLPPRRPPTDSYSKNIEIGDLIDLRVDDDALESKKPPPANPRVPPTKPTKPSSLRTATEAANKDARPPPEVIRRKAAPPLPPRQSSTAHTDSLIDLDTPKPLSRVHTEPVVHERDQDTTTTSRSRPPRPPPPRRTNTTLSATSSASNTAASRPPTSPPKQSYPASAAQAALQYATERLNLSAAPIPSIRPSASNQSLARSSNSYNDSGMPPAPLPNKREELWRRRWERASDALERHGVILGSWRVGSEAKSVCIWLIDEAMKEIKENGVNGKTADRVTQYLGIKYANLKDRFASAELITSQNGIFDATTDGPTALSPPIGCDIELSHVQHQLPKKDLSQSDLDCLNLNIAVPSDATPESKLPVLFFIHGGGFAIGANSWPQAELARLVKLSIEKELPVIIVAINYRLGAPGFLTSEELRSAGYQSNNALRDQRVALQWVQKHISDFGGDPDNVTAGGSSAGGASVTYQLHSQTPLFKRAIAISGTSLLLPALPYPVHEDNYQKAITALGLQNATAEERVKALVEMPGSDLVNKLPPSILSMPALDGDFIQPGVTYTELLKSDSSILPGKRWCKDLFIGDAAIDSSIFEFLAPQIKTNCANKFITAIHKVLSSYPEEAERIINAYGIIEDLPDEEARVLVLNFLAGICFHAPALCFAQGWNGNAYVYHFNEGNPWEGPWNGHANHILDVIYLFQNLNEFLSPEQQAVAVAFAEDVFKFCHGVEPWPAVSGDIDTGFSARVYGPSQRGQTIGLISEAFGGEGLRRGVLFECAKKVSLDELAKVFGEITSS